MEDHTDINLDDIELEYKDVLGAGKQIHARLGKEFMCVEFTLKSGVAQPIMIAAEPWMQFPPLEWNQMVEDVFKEMVELFNEKHSKDKPDVQRHVEQYLDNIDLRARLAKERQSTGFDTKSRDCKYRRHARPNAHHIESCTQLHLLPLNVINRGQCSVHTCPFIPHLWKKRGFHT